MNALLSSGYFRVGRFGRAPIRLHWTTPIGIFIFSGFSLNPFVWASMLFIMVMHELGHAFLARRYAIHLLSLDITGIGGVCRLAGDPTLHEAAIVAWGGVAAQALILVVAVALRAVLHFLTAGLLDGMFDTLITTNAILIALNLLPIKPLDGAMAWRVFRR